MKSIIIANRGEIACRIIRTCRKMGIKSIAVYSDIDKKALHVRLADTAVYIGGNTPNLSYLNQDAIIKAAKATGAEGIHPGYGFLSENYSFAVRCQEEGITLIAPNAEAIRAMGDKAQAKTLMQQYGVPVVRGYQGEEQGFEAFKQAALDIGFPVLLKATAGGGGKGMRVVNELSELQSAFDTCKREALSAFGNDTLLLEQYIASGRHIEFQIFGDKHGNVVHLLERECSIQRRHQKLIEESPSSVLTKELRAKMGYAALNAAKALEYDNAGTVEFILDDVRQEFYFLEVNTRLQVEHCVTEEITGLDLVQMQIESAQGIPLSVQQNYIRGEGYAIEVRLYAEDASNNFMPGTGIIEQFFVPNVDGLRIETGIENNSEISIYYDHTIAKLIVWGQNRAIAHQKMSYVLRNMVCSGVVTNQDFLLYLIEHPDFRAGKYNTHFIQQKIDLDSFDKPAEQHIILALIGAMLWDWNHREQARTVLKALPSGWRNNFNDYQQEIFVLGKEHWTIRYQYLNNAFVCFIKDQVYQVQLLDSTNNLLQLELNGIQYKLNVVQRQDTFFVHNELIGNITLIQQDRLPKKLVEKAKGTYEAPMPSQIIKILVKEGQQVAVGDALIVLSSMKMENTLVADADGIVEGVFVQENTNVEAGTVLVRIN